MSSNRSSENIQQLALQKVKQISESKNKELAKKYRTRARQTPSMLHSIGLLGTLSYLFAAAGNDEYNKVSKEGIIGRSDEWRGIRGGATTSEAKVYAIYLKHIVEYIEHIIGITTTTKAAPTTGGGTLSPIDDGNDNNQVVDIINSLANDTKLLSYCEAVLEPYLVELKSFAEALLESE